MTSPALGPVSPDALECLDSEVLIDQGVAPPGLHVEHGLVRHGVEQRPEGCIAAAVLVAVEHLLGFHIDGDDVGGPEAGGGGHVARAGLRDVVGERTVVSQAGPAHPESLAVHHHGSHGRHQPASTEQRQSGDILTRSGYIVYMFVTYDMIYIRHVTRQCALRHFPIF